MRGFGFQSPNLETGILLQIMNKVPYLMRMVEDVCLFNVLGVLFNVR